MEFKSLAIQKIIRIQKLNMYEKIRTLLKDFSIIDASIRSKDYFYLVASHVYELDDDDDDSANESSPQDAKLLPKQAIRIIAYYPDKPKDKQWGYLTLKNIEFMKCASSSSPVSQFVGVDIEGAVFSVGGGKNASFEQAIPEAKEGPLRGSVRQVVSIDGSVYVVQGNRGICKRLGENKWQTLCANLPVSKSWQARDERGFNCAAGISESSIYAGGGHGDLWHYDGTVWRELSFPTNAIIESMCVDPTGKVYVGCQSGQVYVGNGDVWKKISNGNMTLPFKSMVWYQDKVWCTSDYGVWTISDEVVEKANIPDHIYVKAGCLSVGDGYLLIAGVNGAAYFDGTKWHEFLNFI
jgi:hypothetical protein